MSASLESLMREVPPPMEGASDLGGLFSFIAIGASGSAAFVVLSSLVIWLGTGFEAWVTNTACYAALIVPVYLLQRRFAFRSEASHWHALPRYLAVQGMALMLAAVFSYLIHGVIGMPTVPASMLVIALTSGVNFVVLRGWAFARAPRLEAALA